MEEEIASQQLQVFSTGEQHKHLLLDSKGIQNSTFPLPLPHKKQQKAGQMNEAKEVHQSLFH